MLLKLIDKVLPQSQTDLIANYRICDDSLKLLGLCSQTLDANRRKVHELIDKYTFQFSRKEFEKYYELMSGSQF